MKSWTAAVVGCGRIGSSFSMHPHTGVVSHAEAFVAHPATRLVGVCDLDPAAAEAAASLWSLDRGWTNVKEMLANTQPAIVSVCVPDKYHFAVGKQVIEHPTTKVVIMEKPLALSVADARELVRLAAERQVGLTVNYTRRHASGIQRLKRLLNRGAIGEIQCVSGHYTNGLRHNGSHWLDLLASFFGMPHQITASNPLNELGPDPTLSLTMKLATGAPVTLHACRESCYSCFDMDIVGTAGRMILCDFGNTIEHYQTAEDPQYAGFNILSRIDTWSGGIESALPALIDHVVAFLNDSTTLISTGADALATLECCEATASIIS
jgi:predicted dehydrogenase